MVSRLPIPATYGKSWTQFLAGASDGFRQSLHDRPQPGSALPKAYRFDTDEVHIERLPYGAVVLRAKPQGPLGDRLWALIDGLPDDPTFVRPDQGIPEVRDWLDEPTQTPKPHARAERGDPPKLTKQR